MASMVGDSSPPRICFRSRRHRAVIRCFVFLAIDQPWTTTRLHPSLFERLPTN